MDKDSKGNSPSSPSDGDVNKGSGDSSDDFFDPTFDSSDDLTSDQNSGPSTAPPKKRRVKLGIVIVIVFGVFGLYRLGTGFLGKTSSKSQQIYNVPIPKNNPTPKVPAKTEAKPANLGNPSPTKRATINNPDTFADNSPLLERNRSLDQVNGGRKISPPDALYSSQSAAPKETRASRLGKNQTNQVDISGIAQVNGQVGHGSTGLSVNNQKIPANHQKIISFAPTERSQNDLSLKVDQLTEKLNQIEIANEATKKDLATQEMKLQKVVEKISLLASKLDLFNEKLEDVGTVEKKKTDQNNPEPSPRKKISSSYHIEAIVPGRAWLTGTDGRTFSVVEGDSFPDLGTVIKVDYEGEAVLFSSGKMVS